MGNTIEENQDTVIRKPTKEEYEEAQKNYHLYASWLRKSIERKNQLLDELVVERNNEKTYRANAEKEKEIMQMYEIYEEIEGKNNKEE